MHFNIEKRKIHFDYIVMHNKPGNLKKKIGIQKYKFSLKVQMKYNSYHCKIYHILSIIIFFFVEEINLKKKP